VSTPPTSQRPWSRLIPATRWKKLLSVCLLSSYLEENQEKVAQPNGTGQPRAFSLITHSSANTNENLAFLVEYFNFVEPVQSTKVCRAIDVIAGNRITGIWGLHLSSIEFELCDRVICFYFGAGSDHPHRATPGNGSAIVLIVSIYGFAVTTCKLPISSADTYLHLAI